MKKLALALLCLVSVAFFASCDPENTETGNPSISVLAGDQYIQDNDVVDVDVPYLFGFVVASNPESNKDLASLVVKIGDIEWANVDLTGLKEYTHIDTVEWGYEKEIVFTDEITAVVTDAAGKTATAVINVSVNLPEEPLAVTDFTWNRHGAADATGLAEFGLKWTRNERGVYAVIEPLADATLYKFDPAVWDQVITNVDKAAAFEGMVSISQWKEFDTFGAQDQTLNVVLGTVYNGEMHLMHITQGHIETFKGTDVTLTGQAK
jgi:hypothetical protein